ncbi:hypothetical protein [Aeoliella sp. SH292]|uniref:hypothetical protein n=1 Tax=Aeoliella sp. SH292 TaxID=3454464 RepID=UPI003F945D1E
MLAVRWMLACVAVAGLSTFGCNGSSSTPAGHEEEGHDHAEGEHSHADPKDLHEAVHVLTEMRDELAAGFKAADVKVVDGVIHEMGPMVKKTKELVDSSASDIDRYAKGDAHKALDQIMEVLHDLHPSHAADAKVDPAKYDGQADSLNDALKNLDDIAHGKKVEAPATDAPATDAPAVPATEPNTEAATE